MTLQIELNSSPVDPGSIGGNGSFYIISSAASDMRGDMIAERTWCSFMPFIL